jgi:hypothetical protein
MRWFDDEVIGGIYHFREIAPEVDPCEWAGPGESGSAKTID